MGGFFTIRSGLGVLDFFGEIDWRGAKGSVYRCGGRNGFEGVVWDWDWVWLCFATSAI